MLEFHGENDVLVIVLYAYSILPKLEEPWEEYESGKHLKHLPIHEIHTNLPQVASNLLPFFHAFTGVDTSIDKTTVWESGWNGEM